MVEPLLHFAIPFVSLRAFGLGFRKVLFVSLIALTPDLDVLFQVHRSQSHSFVVLALVVLPLLMLTWNRKSLRSLVLLGAFGLFAHLVLDLFQTFTPALWPILSESDLDPCHGRLPRRQRTAHHRRSNGHHEAYSHRAFHIF